MSVARSFFKWVFRAVLLFVLFIVFFMVGSTTVAGVMPDQATSEPGLVPATAGLLIIALADLLVIAALILTSHWRGWKLAGSLALAYYDAVTLIMQIETWYFLSSITVSPQSKPDHNICTSKFLKISLGKTPSSMRKVSKGDYSIPRCTSVI